MYHILLTFLENMLMNSCDLDKVARTKSHGFNFILSHTISNISRSTQIGGVTHRHLNLHQLPMRASGVEGSAKESL